MTVFIVFHYLEWGQDKIIAAFSSQELARDFIIKEKKIGDYYTESVKVDEL